MVQVRILNNSNNPTPEYKTEGAAGFDIASSETIFISAQGSVLVSTGIHVIIPEGYEGQLRLRSSMYKKPFVMPNAPGTIDSDYRGEIKIPLRNLNSLCPETIVKGERIAQIVIQKLPQVDIEEVSEDAFFGKTTERGLKGFGSTGQN